MLRQLLPTPETLAAGFSHLEFSCDCLAATGPVWASSSISSGPVLQGAHRYAAGFRLNQNLVG
jgi:hypothetical protein